MARWIVNGAFVIILILITLFGLGPAIFADGTDAERTSTLMVVSVLYLIIFAIMFYANKKIRKR